MKVVSSAAITAAHASVCPGLVVSSPRYQSQMLHLLKITRHTPQRLHQCPPPGTIDFWTVVPGRDEATLHLSIEPLASTTACSDAQAVVAVANATSRIPHYPRHITRTPMIVAGAPAIAPRGLPGAPDFGQEIVLAHGGLLYRICTFDPIRAIAGSRKVTIPGAVLQKAGRLTAEEWVLMRAHPAVGADVVGHVPALRVLAPLIHAHHDKWDGSGYPDGLTGEEIPLGARIVAVADAYGFMTTDRPYRPACTPVEALAELRHCAGTQFDPEVVAALELVLATLGAPVEHAGAT